MIAKYYRAAKQWGPFAARTAFYGTLSVTLGPLTKEHQASLWAMKRWSQSSVRGLGIEVGIDGLENVLRMAAWNGGVHANPTFAGDTISAWTEIVERAELPGKKDLGALRMKLYAVKNTDLRTETVSAETTTDGNTSYDPRVVLALDWWGLVPRRM